MTPKDLSPEERKTQLLEEICENTRAVRRVVNRILDHLQEEKESSAEQIDDYDPESIQWDDLNGSDDMFF